MGGGYFRDDEMDRLTKLAAACLSHKLIILVPAAFIPS